MTNPVPEERKINLLIAIAGLGIGGAEVVVQRLAETIDKKRFNLTIACLKVQGPVGDLVARTGIEIVVLGDPDAKRVNYLSFLKLLKLIRERNIEVVHTHTTDALADAALCKLFRPRLRLIHTFHFGNYPHRPPRELMMDRVFSRLASYLLAVGDVQRKQLLKVFGFREKSVGRIWNGVVIPRGSGAAFRAQTGKPGDIIVGTMATLIEQKGLFDLLEVARKVHDVHKNVHFVIIGDGFLRKRLEARRKELGLDGVVTLAGWVSDAAENALPAFDIFFQPSLWEAMSIALLEAMGAGKPSVTTRVGETPFVVENGVDAFLTEPKDIDGMTKALLQLIEDPALRRRMGEAALAKARAKYAVEHMTRAYEAVYAGGKS